MANRAALRYSDRMTIRPLLAALVLSLAACGLVACGGSGTEADRLGIGAQCAGDDECDVETDQVCLMQFKGGYCGLQGCQSDADCPDASACVRHDDGETYCFRICIDKAECNVNRDLDFESNCSSSVDFVEPVDGRKACVPPSA